MKRYTAPVILIFMFNAFVVAQTRFSISYSPHFTAATELGDQCGRSHPGHMIRAGLQFPLGKRTNLTAGMGFTNTDFCTYDYYPMGDYIEIEQHFGNQYILVPVGIRWAIGRLSIHPEFAMAWWVQRNYSFYIVDDHHERVSELSDKDLHDPPTNGFMMPGISLGYDWPFKKFSVFTGINGYFIFNYRVKSTWGIGPEIGLRF